MNHHIARLSCVALAAVSAAPAYAEVVAGYDFTGRSAESSASTELALASAMTKSWGVNFAGSVSSSTLDYFDRSNNAIPDSLEEAVANGRYVEITVSPAVALDTCCISFDLGAYSGLEGGVYEVGAAVFTSATGFESADLSLGGDTHSAPPMTIPTSYKTVSVDLSAVPALQGISSPVTFRIYYYDIAGISNSNAMIRLDNISVTALAEEVAPAAGALKGQTIAGTSDTFQLGWFGSYYHMDGSHNYFHFDGLDWVYVQPDAQLTSLYLYNFDDEQVGGWCWTTPAIYPWVWNWNLGESGNWFYIGDGGDWIYIAE
ncbi:MAG: hypothetical protein Q7P63_07120 [Verrucomicrobiota bacterium JB022]|nr:hypothetical protein [Verrucomicrobiota bacterium JB022]